MMGEKWDLNVRKERLLSSDTNTVLFFATFHLKGLDDSMAQWAPGQDQAATYHQASKHKGIY